MRGTYQPFFVTGLLRSRTGWLANWLTYERSFCWHDAFRWSTQDGLAQDGLVDSLCLMSQDPERWLDDALEGLPRLFRDTAYRMRLREGRLHGAGVLIGRQVYVGMSDPACAGVWDCLAEMFPDAPWVIIQRPVEDVARSCGGLVSVDWLRQQQQMLEDCAYDTRALVVPFDEIDVMLHEIGYHVMGGEFIANTHRDKQLKTWNVQVPMNHIRDVIQSVYREEDE